MLRSKLPLCSVFGLGLSCALLPLGNHLYYLMIFMFTLSVFGVLCNVPASSQITIATPDKYRSRVFSLLGFMCQGINPLAMAIIGVAMAHFGINETAITMGLALAGLALISPFIPHFFEFFNATQKEAQNFYEKNYGIS